MKRRDFLRAAGALALGAGVPAQAQVVIPTVTLRFNDEPHEFQVGKVSADGRNVTWVNMPYRPNDHMR